MNHDHHSLFVETHCVHPTAPHITYCFIPTDTLGVRFHDPKSVTCPICRRNAKSPPSYWTRRQASPPAPADPTSPEPDSDSGSERA